ncbi:ATPase subunit of ABC transporter with duplicated ATPase domains [Novosphingobium sp. PhB165]|uniref:ABC-F family ATP-binding cassette domain-containing protein n=1 Tax=Novosphingobium sp. PhB165 TaxID=2485105 RepID=UPI0010D36DA1|nr:ABC-F family ATP-binding cassette domain-containing protein [Novosphingobium sp. PhB165]TCM20485.1 ATPase subunit of ABC transporter with duplicated ATPase domains [Novosphingobium sp. PhB165]
MPAPSRIVSSLSLADVSWSTPDGQPVLTHLSIDFSRERAGIVGRNGVGKSTLLRLLTGTLEPERGQVIRSGTIGTMRQIVQVSPEETIADLMDIAPALAVLRRAEAGTATLDELAEADWTLEARLAEALAQVGLDMAPETRLAALSGGQRTRVALAGAVFARPDFLLLDEPTNDLDREGRRAVRELLEGWRAGAVVVSHDRELLEAMDAIVEMTTLGAARYGGNWSAYRERKAVELAAAEQDLAAAERRISEVKRKAQVAVERKQRRDAAGSRKAARGDMPRILAGARRDRAEKSGGDNARLADRIEQAASQGLDEAKSRVERLETLSVSLAPTGLAAGQRVLDVRGATFGHEPGVPLLKGVNLTLTGPERVAVTGPNGAGKSTLLALVAGRSAPWSGSAGALVPFAFLDQRLSLLDPAASIVENFARLNPGMDDNGRRAALARFQFRASAADRVVGTLSGGQTLRAALACVLGGVQPPPLLMLDEPTNHLDLDSIAAVEAGLRAYDGALLVVSHDEAFLDAIGVSRRFGLG